MVASLRDDSESHDPINLRCFVAAWIALHVNAPYWNALMNNFYYCYCITLMPYDRL